MSRPARDGGRFGGLHVLADDDPRWSLDPVEQARAGCEGGASVIQLRAKHATDGQALEWAARIRRATSDCGALFLVNDRFDLALAADADGVHLGQEDLPPSAIPRSCRGRLAVGRSTHDLSEARAALDEEVDYVAIGPVFGTSSKATPYGARGLALVREVAALVAPLPLVAIGGLTASNLPAVIGAGAAGAAVISAVAGAPSPVAAVRDLVSALGGSLAPPEPQATP